MQMMAGLAVRDREEFDGVAERGELCGSPPESDLAIVGMRADTYDPHPGILRCARLVVQFRTVVEVVMCRFVTGSNICIFNMFEPC
jgi:hypothetical protein